MLCISFMQSSNFSSVSFCFSVRDSSNSSRFRATSFSSSFSRLSPRVHCSKGDMLPYHNSSIVFIRPSAHRKGDCISEFSLGNTVTVLFHFFYCNQGLTDNFKLTERMRIRYEFLLSSEYLLDHLAHDAVLVAVE